MYPQLSACAVILSMKLSFSPRTGLELALLYNSFLSSNEPFWYLNSAGTIGTIKVLV